MKQMRILYAANLLTILGTAITFIPLGNYLSPQFGVIGAFSLLLVLSKLPQVVCANLYARLGARLGIEKMIALSELLAAIFAGVTLIGLYVKSPFILLSGLTATAFTAAPLNSLFPGFLHERSTTSEDSKGLFSNWYLIQHLALILSTFLGAYLEKLFSIQTIILIDAISFLVAAVSWEARSIVIKSPKASSISELPTFNVKAFTRLPQKAKRLQLYNFIRNVLYGFINPILPALVLETYGAGSIKLGSLYLFLGFAAMAGGYLARHIKLNRKTFFSLNITEVFLLTVSLIPLGFMHLLGFGTTAVILMGINEVSLQTLFFSSQPNRQSISISTAFEQVINIGVLAGYFLSNIIPFNWRMSAIVVLAASSAILLVRINKQNEREESLSCAK